MPDQIPLSAADLRRAMRDQRYWQPGHPERSDYGAWVGDAWRQFHDAEGRPRSDGLVWVAPYTRTRDGETEQVSGHFRNTGRRGAADDAADGVSVEVEDAPAAGIERRYTARDASGQTLGSCETLTDGSQICTLTMPEGGTLVQGVEAGDGELIPVAAMAAPYAFAGVLTAATSFYAYLRNRLPAMPGAGAAPDTPFLLFYRGFEGTEKDVRVTVGTLSPERVNEFCPKTAEFEESLSGIVASTPREGQSAQQWGTAVHTRMRDTIRKQYGPQSNVVQAELSLADGEERPYGRAGSSRLDIYHAVEGTGTVCAYDIKTGQAGLKVVSLGVV
jgi:hypothetical protein